MGGSNKERKSRGGHGLFDWYVLLYNQRDKIRDDRWKGVYLGSSVHGISSRYAKVKDLEWYKKVDGKDITVNTQDELDEIKRKEEEAFAQALGYSAPSVKKSIPTLSKQELNQVITDTSANYTEEQGGIGFSSSSLRNFKDSIKDHLNVPVGNEGNLGDKVKQSISEPLKDQEKDANLARDKRSRDKRSPDHYSRRRDDKRTRDKRSPSPYSRRKYRRSPTPDRYRKRSKSPYSRNHKSSYSKNI